MARPPKQGLDYFPLDVDFDRDDKVELIEAEFGERGFAILIKLIARVYKMRGYYLEWNEENRLLFGSRVKLDMEKVQAIVDRCLKWKLFDPVIYEKHNILTSAGIQRRFAEATIRRKSVKLVEKYLCEGFNVDEYNHLRAVSVNINGSSASINDDINPPSDTINTDLTPQSKVKKSKVDKYSESSEEVRLSKLLFHLIRNRNSKQKQPLFQVWAKSIDLMMRIDGRKCWEIEEMINWCQADDFWQDNILSTIKLRKQYDQLTLKMGKAKKKEGVRSRIQAMDKIEGKKKKIDVPPEERMSDRGLKKFNSNIKEILK